jgi:hypothetical protein
MVSDGRGMMTKVVRDFTSVVTTLGLECRVTKVSAGEGAVSGGAASGGAASEASRDGLLMVS